LTLLDKAKPLQAAVVVVQKTLALEVPKVLAGQVAVELL
jgi:hypothetical protein